jgi:hypothetical protein
LVLPEQDYRNRRDNRYSLVKLARRAPYAAALLLLCRFRIEMQPGGFIPHGEAMPGRRRETRFAMSPPWSGSLQTLEDVVVERAAKSDIWVLSSAPASRDDGMILELPREEGTAGVKVRVAESRPVVVDDRLQHRVRLHVIDAPDGDKPRD